MKKKNSVKIKFIENTKLKIIFLKILYGILAICIFYNIIFLINTTITKKEYLSIFGISVFSMPSNNMKPEIKKNELIITKIKKEEDFNIGDFISYQVNENIRINKIINIHNDNGKKFYITKSNVNYYPDIEEINSNQIIGKVYIHIPFLGFFINILQSKITTIIIIIFLILKFSYNKYVYMKKRERKRKQNRFNRLN